VSNNKLTLYQMRVVLALKSGHRLHFMTGLNAHWFIGHIKPRPTDSTVKKLKQLKVITLIKSDWRGEVWEWAGPLEPPKEKV